jgi:hypothetical protein
MSQELFIVKPEGFYNDKGTQIDTLSILLVRIINFQAFSSVVEGYIEKRNEKNELLKSGYNVTINTPDNWGADDMVVIKAFAAHPDVDCEIEGIYVPLLTDVIGSLENADINE